METPVDIVDLEDYDDGGGLFFSPISDKGTDKKNLISVEHCNEIRELNLAIMASLGVKNVNFVDDDDLTVLDRKPESSSFRKKPFSNHSVDDDDDDLTMLDRKPESSSFRKKPFSNHSVTELGQSLKSKIQNGNFIDDDCYVLDRMPESSSFRKKPFSNHLVDDDDDLTMLDRKPESSSFRKKPFSNHSVTELGQSLKSKIQNGNFIDDDCNVLDRMHESSSFRKKPFSNHSVTELGQSSNVKTDFVCEICIETKSLNESFEIKGCSHFYCTECISNYVSSKLDDNMTNIPCPVSDCKGLLEPEYCRHILSKGVFNRWGHALCEGLILESQKFYCPFKDCSALLIDDGENTVMESECPYCRRLFCAQCKVPWHAGIECAEFQKLGDNEREKEDIMLMKLAKKKNWQRCPACKFYVEKTEGCLYMKCRCGAAFCYNCRTISTDHRYHYCSKCRH